MELETAAPTENNLKEVPRELRHVFHYIFENSSVELKTVKFQIWNVCMCECVYVLALIWNVCMC